jgi:uncharacterized protein (TIGR04141 family)
MSNNASISINLCKLDMDRVAQVLPRDNAQASVPKAIITRYNAAKSTGDSEDARYYRAIDDANSSEFAIANNLSFFRKEQAATVSHSWTKFFQKQEIPLGNLQSAVPNIVCFVTIEDEVYAFTTGSASVVFESLIDQSFPIEIAKRIVNPEVKGGKQQAISGAIQASDIYFRRPTRINAANSHQDVWKNLSGTITETVRTSERFQSIFGKRRSVSVEIKASIKISARLDDPQKILDLLNWFRELVDTELTDQQKQDFSFYDSIRPLNMRKDSLLINELTDKICHKFIDYNPADCELSLSHEESSKFINADAYKLRLAGNEVFEWTGVVPDAQSISAQINAQILPDISDIEKLEKFKLLSWHEDEPYLNTDSSVLSHLSGELKHNDTVYYLLNGSWYRVEDAFLVITDNTLKDTLRSGFRTGLKYDSLGLSTYNHPVGGEPTYNKNQAGENKIIADAIFYKGIELSDILHYGDQDFIDIIHVKRGLGNSTRDLVSQMRNAIEIIENDLNLEGQPALHEYYASLVRTGRITDNMSEQDFIAMFIQRKRRYNFTYTNTSELTPELVDTIGSSIAKNEIVSLVQYSKQFRDSTSVNLVWVPESST